MSSPPIPPACSVTSPTNSLTRPKHYSYNRKSRSIVLGSTISMRFNAGALICIRGGIFRIVSILFVAVCVAAASDRVTASCGDYLVKQPHLPGISHHVDDTSSTFVVLTRSLPGEPLCTGSGCGRAPQSPSEPHLNHFQRVSFRDLNALLHADIAADDATQYLEQNSKVLLPSADRDRVIRPPDST